MGYTMTFGIALHMWSSCSLLKKNFNEPNPKLRQNKKWTRPVSTGTLVIFVWATIEQKFFDPLLLNQE